MPDYPASYTASDYLAWSDQFTNEFDFIREALARPAARIEPQNPDPARPRNFVSLRILAQALGQRAQSGLLLDQPAGALRDLTSLRQLPRLFAEQPTNLVQGMMEVAVEAVYSDVIADGLHLHVWREPELATLKEQLRGFDLFPLIINGMSTERAATCRTLRSGDFKTILENESIRIGIVTDSIPSQKWQKMKCRALTHVPADLINGQPLRYRRTADGHFLLYSVGWNEIDDGGAVIRKWDGQVDQDSRQGDWVWEG